MNKNIEIWDVFYDRWIWLYLHIRWRWHFSTCSLDYYSYEIICLCFLVDWEQFSIDIYQTTEDYLNYFCEYKWKLAPRYKRLFGIYFVRDNDD